MVVGEERSSERIGEVLEIDQSNALLAVGKSSGY